jgi:hypothetical protein
VQLLIVGGDHEGEAIDDPSRRLRVLAVPRRHAPCQRNMMAVSRSPRERRVRDRSIAEGAPLRGPTGGGVDAVRRLVAAACAEATAIDPDIAGSIDARLIRRHLLAPLAHELGVPGFERDHLVSSLLAEHRVAAAGEAVDALVAAGIPVMLIKGIAYAGRLYPDPATRPMSDIDLLVPAGAHRDAAAALRRRGYWLAGPSGERTPFHHALTLKRRGAAIDLHRSVVQPLRAAGRSESLWQRARRAQAPFAAALLPDPTDETLIALAHIARHELAVPAINFVDAARLLARADASTLEERAAAMGLRRAVKAAVAMTAALAAEDPGGPSVLPSTTEILALETPPRLLQIARKLALLDGPLEALRLAANTLGDRWLG